MRLSKCGRRRRKDKNGYNKSIVPVVLSLSTYRVHQDTGDKLYVKCKLQGGHGSTACVITQSEWFFVSQF